MSFKGGADTCRAFLILIIAIMCGACGNETDSKNNYTDCSDELDGLSQYLNEANEILKNRKPGVKNLKSDHSDLFSSFQQAKQCLEGKNLDRDSERNLRHMKLQFSVVEMELESECSTVDVIIEFLSKMKKENNDLLERIR